MKNLKFLFGLIILGLYSCNHLDEGTDLGEQTVSEIILPPELDASGKIAFKNLSSFSDFVEKNIYKDPENLQFFDGKFVSLKMKTLQKAEANPAAFKTNGEEPDIEEDPVILDDFTASIVNEDRELIIENRVVKYTRLGTLVFHEDFRGKAIEVINSLSMGDIETINNEHDFEEDSFYELDPGVFLFSANWEDEMLVPGDDEIIGGGGGGSSPGNTPSLGSDNFNFIYCNRTNNAHIEAEGWGHWTGGVRKTSYRYFESNRRMKAKAWSTNYATHSSGGFFTKLQRRNLGIWWSSDADIVSVSVKAQCYYPHQSIAGLYFPFEIDPSHESGRRNLNDTNVARVAWGFMTAQIGISYNMDHAFDCDPNNDFNGSLNSFVTGDSKYCKPKWKASKRVKIKNSESCHYVKRGGYEGEIRIYINKDV